MEKPVVLQLRQACDEHVRSVARIMEQAASEVVDGNPLPIFPGDTLERAEAVLITATLELHQGDKLKTAVALGISIKTLYTRLREYAAAERREPRRASQQQPAA